MALRTLVGDFSVNGQPSSGMDVDISHPVYFNEVSGIVAVRAVDPQGKTVKGVAIAAEPTLKSISELGQFAIRDESVIVPNFS